MMKDLTKTASPARVLLDSNLWRYIVDVGLQGRLLQAARPMAVWWFKSLQRSSTRL
ncbi:hypothetical protein U8C31_30325 (plasmid) [Sinorhizobium medicae]|uniref:hypothetical protein n=1 Tax=Sinorhizobium medicae TaxID=110321 RepID=UPI002AF6C477|nr:hypothetical protein [Sinorhizobium medicae]WQO76112.1 hypothetical protein U8C31_30325 [Sinorhizobium medicae]